MSEVQQNTLYLLTPGSFVFRDHLTLQVDIPVAAESPGPREGGRGEESKARRRVSIPVHHLESICLFGASTITAPALELCWEHGIAVNYLSQHGRLLARATGIPDSSVPLRRSQFRTADDVAACLRIARQIVAGKIQNCRASLRRAAREASPEEAAQIEPVATALGTQLRDLIRLDDLDSLRGAEGIAAKRYFSVFSLLLKQQRADFRFTLRSRRPPRDRINCLLSFLYALLRHDCAAACAACGLDPFVGFLHADRSNRPSLALDLMEEFRPWLADRLAVTLINRQQVGAGHFRMRDGGAVELSDAGRRLLIRAFQERKQDTMMHPALGELLRLGQMPFVQARILARHLRGDMPEYLPLVPK